MRVVRAIYHSYFNVQNESDIMKEIPSLRADLRRQVKESDLLAASLFRWENHLFLYCEYTNSSYTADDFTSRINKYLLNIRTDCSSKWHRMWDIYHMNVPKDQEQWKRKISAKTSSMIINRLKPEKFSSYIYWHYQRQEERLGENDKYCLICQDDGLMVFYREQPEELEESPTLKALNTSNTPPEEEWQRMMGEHFKPWRNYDEPWMPIECLIGLIY